MRILAGLLVVFLGCAPEPAAPEFERFATGTGPNSIAIVKCGVARVAVVTASAGARLDAIGLDGVRSAGLDFSFENGSNPWGIAPFKDGVLVTLYNSHVVAFVDPCTGVEFSRSGSLEPVDVAPAVIPRAEFDADLDGNPDSVIDAMIPHNPSGIAVDSTGGIWVAFSNIVDPAIGENDMQTGPGILARFIVDNNKTIRFVDQHSLPCQNPTGVATFSGRVAVTCAGRFRSESGTFTRASAGGIILFSTIDFSLVASTDLDQSFGTPAFESDTIVVGSVLGGTIFRFSSELTLIEDRVIGGVDESLFKVVLVNGKSAVSRFVAGDLVIDPFGLASTVPFSDPREPPRGLIDVAIDDTDSDGLDDEAVGALSLSGEIGRVHL